MEKDSDPCDHSGATIAREAHGFLGDAARDIVAETKATRRTRLRHPSGGNIGYGQW